MEFTLKRTVQVIAALLVVAAVTQAIYTAIYIAKSEGLTEMSPPRQLLWGAEGFIFVGLAAFAGAAMLQTKSHHLGWSAIAFAAVLNVVQVGVGLTMFAPFISVAAENDALVPLRDAVVAFSFMVYNAAKILLGLAALVFGMAKMNEGGKALGGLTALVGVVAMITNTASMAMGREVFGELPLAGGSGVLATVLLALCLSVATRED